MVTPKVINILLIDDHSLFREGLGRLLQSEPALRVVGSCNSVRDGVAVLEKEQVDIVLLDFDLGEAGLETQILDPDLGYRLVSECAANTSVAVAPDVDFARCRV